MSIAAKIKLYLICTNICCVFMHIDQDCSNVYLLRYSRSRCLFVAWWWWWWWTSITSSSQTSLPGDVTTVVPPFNHPISQQHTPLLSLDEATQSHLPIGCFIRHEEGIKQSRALMRAFLRVFGSPQSTTSLNLGAHTLIQITRAHTMRQPLLNVRTYGPVLFSKQIMTS